MSNERKYVKRYIGEVDVNYEPINEVLYELNKLKQEAENIGYINIEVYSDNSFSLEVYGERLESPDEFNWRIRQEEASKKERFDQYQKLKEEFKEGVDDGGVPGAFDLGVHLRKGDDND